MANLPPEKIASDKRTLRIVWLAVVSGVLVLCGIMTFLLEMGERATLSDNRVVFAVGAALSIVCILLGFMIQRSLDASLSLARSYEDAASLIRSRSILSIAVVEVSALFAAIATFLTGEPLNLLFVVPFLAFAWLFFPSETRFAYWHALGRNERT